MFFDMQIPCALTPRLENGGSDPVRFRPIWIGLPLWIQAETLQIGSAPDRGRTDLDQVAVQTAPDRSRSLAIQSGSTPIQTDGRSRSVLYRSGLVELQSGFGQGWIVLGQSRVAWPRSGSAAQIQSRI